MVVILEHAKHVAAVYNFYIEGVVWRIIFLYYGTYTAVILH
jgi:hypothetical protein